MDDEPTIAEVVARYLERAGYETRVAEDGPSAVAAALSSRPDLVVLDVMLPGFDGLEVMRRLHEDLDGARARDPADGEGRGGRPRRRPPSRRRRLRGQAVLARRARRARGCRAAPQRGEPEAGETAPLRRPRDRPAARAPCRSADRPVELTQREFDLLHFLARNPGQVFSRDQLMDRVWRFAFYTDTTTVTVHIRRLRAKIEADPRSRGGSRPCGASAIASARSRDEPVACDRGGRRRARRRAHHPGLRRGPGLVTAGLVRPRLGGRARAWPTRPPASRPARPLRGRFGVVVGTRSG